MAESITTFGIYTNLTHEDIIAISYLSAVNSWGITDYMPIPNQCGCVNGVFPAPEYIWETFDIDWDLIDYTWETIP